LITFLSTTDGDNIRNNRRSKNALQNIWKFIHNKVIYSAKMRIHPV